MSTNQIIVSMKNGKFELVKDTGSYSSYWVCVSGRCPGVFGRDSSGTIVPVVYRSQLYAAAIEAGYSQEDLSTPKRPVKAVATGRTRKASTKKAAIRISLGDILKRRSAKTATL
jgi:hypothetical protein